MANEEAREVQQCKNCGVAVAYSSQHLVGGRTPGWRCAAIDALGEDDRG